MLPFRQTLLASALLPALSAATTAQPRPPGAPDFAALLRAQFLKCATITKEQEPREATLRVKLDRQGRVIGEPAVLQPGGDAEAQSFEQAAREGLKSCGPYALARRHPGAFGQWGDLTLTISSGEMRRDPGWSGGRRLSGGASETAEVLIKRGQDFAALGAFTTVGAACEVTAQGKVTIEQRPTRGRLRSLIAPSPARFAESHRLAHCNGVIIPGTVVRYDRMGRKPGQDSFRFTVRFQNGEIRTITARVTLE